MFLEILVLYPYLMSLEKILVVRYSVSFLTGVGYDISAKNIPKILNKSSKQFQNVQLFMLARIFNT